MPGPGGAPGGGGPAAFVAHNTPEIILQLGICACSFNLGTYYICMYMLFNNYLMGSASYTVNQDTFARILLSLKSLKDIFATLKIATRAWFTTNVPISVYKNVCLYQYTTNVPITVYDKCNYEGQSKITESWLIRAYL